MVQFKKVLINIFCPLNLIYVKQATGIIISWSMKIILKKRRRERNLHAVSWCYKMMSVKSHHW